MKKFGLTTVTLLVLCGITRQASSMDNNNLPPTIDQSQLMIDELMYENTELRKILSEQNDIIRSLAHSIFTQKQLIKDLRDRTSALENSISIDEGEKNDQEIQIKYLETRILFLEEELSKKTFKKSHKRTKSH